MLNRMKVWAAAGVMAAMPLAGCEDLPGGEKEQGAVLGGVAGGIAGAVIGGEDNRLLGGLIGAAAGAGGGYLIGAQMEKADGDDEDRREAQQAVDNARNDPATAADVQVTTTADLNSDGFVTMDEVIAMDKAGLSDQEMLARLSATNQIFELTATQEDYLVDQGVSRYVVAEMQKLNFEQRQQLLQERQVIGRN